MTQNLITVLVEDTVHKQGLLGEHGLAFWIEYNGKKILFDTGQSNVLIHNSEKLGINLGQADIIALSHGHYDHAGGLPYVLDLSCKPQLYCHQEAFAAKYTRNEDGRSRRGDAAIDYQSIYEKAEVKFSDSPVEICPNIWLTGSVTRLTEFEDTGGSFFADSKCIAPDLIPDDQAVFIEAPYGTVVILGCAHAGVINTLNYIRKLTADHPIHTVIGGMHLAASTEERMDKTVRELRNLNIKLLFPCHCTGFNQTARLWREFPEQCFPCVTGSTISLDLNE